MFEQLVFGTGAAYRRWLESVADDVLAANGLVVMYCRSTLPERNSTYAIGEWLAGYLMIGDDSGGRGFFLRCDGGAGPVFRVGLGALDEDELEVVAATFEAWLGSGFALPPDPEPDLPHTVDVFVDRIPADAVRLLVRVRALLGADWPFGELRGLLAGQPFLAVRSVHLFALRRKLEDAADLRPYLFYDSGAGLTSV